MRPRPVVSVALCTHNGTRYLKEQVHSILGQSEPPAQVVVSDDASTDGTVELIEAIWRGLDPASAPELVVLRNITALGVTKNFEQAARACRGELIALSDQDDVWAPDRLERMTGAFCAAPDLALLFTDARLVDSDGADLGPSLFETLEIAASDLARVRSGHAFGVLIKRNLVTGATVVFRRSLLDDAVPFDPAWVHDEWLAIIAAATGRVDWMPDQLIDYRQHGGNQIGVTAPTLRYKIGRVLEARGDRYAGLLERAEHLQKHLESVGVHPEVLAEAAAKVEHQRRRADLPALRIARVVPVLREAVAGKYARYSSQGNLDVVRDLLSPVGDRS